ncbi:MAG: thiosulfate/3-mercaptopyruvate sulfurtransferase [Thermoleophilaceae bacterium]|jgi:thiosulfate/3-mercaptopyruvate sulfurtransferase|nr:thiosulfate/3-mercaptopyruvate sulfurtransferase [Thermoleophilaceae bacterium]
MAIGPLVSAGWLLDRVGQRDLVVVDCRFALGLPGEGRLAWEDAHIPGAHYLDVDEDLSAPPGTAGGGRHPLPAAEDFAAAAASAGIGADSTVVAYDAAGEGGAARLWWLLRHFGHDDVAVLDGGLRAWRAAGGPLDDLPPRPWSSGAPFVPRERAGDMADAEELSGRLEDDALVLVDARAPARFRGEVEPVDPVAGHIPGARNVSFASLAPDGRFLDPAELRARLDPGDGRELVAYCGSGITASTVVLAAEAAGLEARLYPGSWSDWCARDLPVARGG